MFHQKKKNLIWCLNLFHPNIFHNSLQPKDMVEFLLLINQVICKFSSSVAGMLEEIFPAIASRLFNILSSDAFPSGPGYNTEVRVFT